MLNRLHSSVISRRGFLQELTYQAGLRDPGHQSGSRAGVTLTKANLILLMIYLVCYGVLLVPARTFRWMWERRPPCHSKTSSMRVGSHSTLDPHFGTLTLMPCVCSSGQF